MENKQGLFAIDYERIGLRIRKARKEAHKTQEQLAEDTGISVSFLGHIERGARKMSLETFSRLSIALDLSPFYLLYGGRDPFLSSTQKAVVFEALREMVDELSERWGGAGVSIFNKQNCLK